MKFEQIYVSGTLKDFFSMGIKNKWNLKDYQDVNSPAIFFGLYSDKDRSVLANHKNKSLVIWGGKDMSYEKSLTLVKSLVDKKISATWVYPGFFSKILDNYNIKHKKIYIPIKDYNPFQPEVLGDKIYCYKGVLGNRGDYFKWNEIIKPLIDRYGLEKIIFTENKNIETLKNDFYKKSFVYIKPNERGGCTTMFELAHMGRKTIGIGHEESGFFSNYSSINDLFEKIDNESKKIGTIDENVCSSVKNMFINNNDWLNFEFYE
jgi:hypothetical protein